jgi:hypothetical protein
LAGLGTLLDVRDELLLRGLELGTFPVELTLRLRERALVLPQPLCGSDGPAEQRFLVDEPVVQFIKCV